MPSGVYKRSSTHCANLSKALKGNPKLGHPGRKLSIEHRLQIAKAQRNRKKWKHSEETKAKIQESNKGRKVSSETKKKMKKNHADFSREKHPRWKGGITKTNLVIRTSKKYKEWRHRVFVRDGFSCVECGQVGGKIHAHHILSFSKYPKQRLKVNNGVTLCEGCHRLQHKKRGA